MWLPLALVLAAEPDRALVVDRVAVVVGDRLVTTSDVELEEELARHDLTGVAALDSPDTSPLDRLVDYAVARAAAGDVAIYKPADADVQARWRRFRARWERSDDYEAFLARWGLDDEALKALFSSRLVAERYILRTLTGQSGVSAADPASIPLYRQWMDDLRARTRIRTPS